MEIQNSKLKEVYTELEADLTGKADLTQDALAALKTKYIGKNGILKGLLGQIKEQKPEDRATYGKEANLLNKYFAEQYEILESGLKGKLRNSAAIDITAPFDINTPTDKRPKLLAEPGHQNPLTKELEYMLCIFEKMGFDMEESRQLDDDYHMFESLNFPIGHPARDNYDSFRTDEGLIPPAQTSTMQNRMLKKYGAPCRVVIPGRTFRNEATDASHEHTFFQIEGIYVDKNVTMGDMLATIKAYLEAFFEKELRIKVQPAYFPFTEPDAEFLASCPFCNQTGCRVCGYTGWMELMGCGMIHPNVLREADVDPEVWSGFAWGFGLDRLTLLKNGVNDIRFLNSGNLDFITQF